MVGKLAEHEKWAAISKAKRKVLLPMQADGDVEGEHSIDKAGKSSGSTGKTPNKKKRGSQGTPGSAEKTGVIITEPPSGSSTRCHCDSHVTPEPEQAQKTCQKTCYICTEPPSGKSMWCVRHKRLQDNVLYQAKKNGLPGELKTFQKIFAKATTASNLLADFEMKHPESKYRKYSDEDETL